MVCGSPTVSWPVSPLQASSGPCVTGAVMGVRSGSSCLFTQSCSEFSEHQFCARHLFWHWFTVEDKMTWTNLWVQ